MELETNRAQALRNREMLRGANAHLERDAERSGKSDDDLTHVLCECAEACGGTIAMTFHEWEAIHQHANRYTVAPGHEAPAVERVVHRCDRYLAVEKFPLATPRTAGPRGTPSRQ
jgi:hypothetical protein